MQKHILPVVLALVALCTGLVPSSVSRASHSTSAADLYYRAYDALDHASRFDTVTRITYVMYRRRAFSSHLRFIAPHRALQSSDLGGELGTSWQVHVNNVYCSWNVGPSFRRIFCQHLPWDHSAISLEADNHPAEIHVVHAHFSFGHDTRAVWRVKVTGRAGLGCPLDVQCPAAMQGTLTGVLTVDAHRLLPLSFSAVVGNRSPYERLSLVYRYGHRLAVNLPGGAPTPCPRYAPPHGWCLSQHRSILGRIPAGHP